MIEVECQTLEEALEAGKAGAHIVMLDNFEPGTELFEAAATIKKAFPHLTIEASGVSSIRTIILPTHIEIALPRLHIV